MAGASWVRIDTNYLANSKMRRAGRDGTLLHLASVLYCGDHAIDDGIVPAEVLPLLGWQSYVRNVEQVGQSLIKAGLWVPLDEGVLVHDYDQVNGVESSAWRDRERKRRDRERKRRSGDTSAEGTP